MTDVASLHAHRFSTNPAGTAGANRRQEARVSTDEPAKMRVLRPLDPLGREVRVLDISKGGLKLQVPDPLQPGMLVQVRLRTAIALAEVRYCVPAGGVYHAGLRLQDVFWTRGIPA